jgi:hypothetical protein
VICTGLLALFFPRTPAVGMTALNVFGYVDLAQILSAVAVGVGLSIVGYRSINAHKLIGEKIFISTVVPTAILFAALTIAQWQTHDSFTLPEGVQVNTNRIDVRLSIAIPGPNGMIDLTDFLDKTCRYESKLLLPPSR